MPAINPTDLQLSCQRQAFLPHFGPSVQSPLSSPPHHPLAVPTSSEDHSCKASNRRGIRRDCPHRKRVAAPHSCRLVRFHQLSFSRGMAS